MITSVLCSAASAHAERALVLPVSGAPARQALREAAEASAIAWLRSLGTEVVRPHETAAPAAHRCTTASCAADLLPGLDIDLAVAAAVWDKSVDGAMQPALYVTLVDRQGGRYPGEALIGESAQAAMQAALLAAQHLRLLGPGPWLFVEGTPEGARVRIDGADAGALPYRGAITAGAHEVEIIAPDHRTEHRTLEIPLNALHVERMQVALAAGDEHSGAWPAIATAGHESGAAHAIDDEPPVRAASPWNYVLGGALVAGAALLAIDPVRTLASDGDCLGRTDSQGRCSARSTFGSRSALQSAAAGALLLGGVAVLVFQPLRVAVSADAGHVLAQISVQL